MNFIVVHLYIFWYIPINSNMSFYGKPECSDKMQYGCMEFLENPSIRTLYTLYCVYFFISASQIG
jgi:hypothetical protein